MKLRHAKQKDPAFTLPELLIVIAAIVALMVLMIDAGFGSQTAKRRAQRINCVSNLKQVNLAFLIWAGDHDNKYPMAISATNGGAMESMATGDLVNCFIVMSNELSTPKILVCPADWGRTAATNFGDHFNVSHISYFIGVDADKMYPARVMSGDANLLISGTLVKSGLVQYPMHTPIAWGPGRHGDVPVHHFWTPKPHGFVGNIGYADGSVAEVSSAGLLESFSLAGLATNRLAIP